MTANVITYRERSAVREVGKALGFPEEAIGRLSKCIHYMDAFEDGERVKHYLEMAGFDPSHARLQHLARLCREILQPAAASLAAPRRACHLPRGTRRYRAA